MHTRLKDGLLLVAALLVFAPSRAGAAPEGGYWHFTPVAGWVKYSDKQIYPWYTTDDAPGYGARFGKNFNEYWGLELAGLYSTAKEDSTDRDITYYNASGNLVFTPVTWAAGAPFLSFGGGYQQRKTDNFDKLNYGTFEVAAGWTAWFGTGVGLRLEARNVLSIPEKNFGSANKSDQQYLGGLTLAWGGVPKDTDGDGVADRKDKCPGTPAGARVDLTGCPTDADGDGVFDGLDQCPGTPKGATVDAKGCPSDADGDGVFDGLDQCADTPKGATVDAKGCPSDSDGDGVPDGIDQCANTPTGSTVDARGCPSDSDGDGVSDGLDKCPNTPSGAKVDTDGCPIVVTERETELLDTGMIRLQNVNFETAKADLLPESYGPLDEVGAILRKWSELKIEIGGHTDSRGSAAYNQGLSNDRANAVRNYLLQKFPDLKADQLTAQGYGESKPIAPNNNQLNMAKNRRVEFVVQNKDVLKKEVERRKTLQR